MRKILVGIALMLSVLPVWAEDEIPNQVGAFITYCKTNNEGCTNKIAQLNFAMLVTAPINREFCPGNKTNVVSLVTPQVLQWLTAHPETNMKSTSEGIQLALIQLYPCKY